MRLVVEEERRNDVLSLPELLLLDRMWRLGETGLAEAATLLQGGEQDAADALAGLVRRGVCRGEGVGERRRWRLAVSQA